MTTKTTSKIGKVSASLTYCPNCKTEYWRSFAQLGRSERCGVCEQKTVFISGPAPKIIKKSK